MDDKTYKIVLADGTSIENLKLNGNNFIARTMIDPEIFSGNCSPVVISDGTDEEIHSHMELVQVTESESGDYWFVLRDISEEELLQKTFMEGVSIMAVKTLSDEEALTVVAIFPAWSASSVVYKTGDRVKYGSQLYKCLQDHTSQESWTPAVASSLWVRVDDPTVEWPEWVQPTGSHDAYAKGDKVTHNGKKYISDADANVWEPGVFGWTEQE